MPTERVEIETPSGIAWADLDRPRGMPSAVLLLGHGASGGVETRDLHAVRNAAVAAGVLVGRISQPYRVLGRRAPAPAPRLDEAWLAVVSAIRRRRGLAKVPIAQGGRSSGARVAVRTAAQAQAVGVVALAFPVHPPGRPEKTRLPELELYAGPTLIVQGDRDAFGMPPADEHRRLVVIPGADHSLKKDPVAVAAAVLAFLTELGLTRG